MFGLKLMLTIIITLALVGVYLGSNPNVAGFFEKISDQMSFSDSTSRNIEFSLVTDKYTDMEFSVHASNFTIVGDTTASLKTGNLRAGNVSIYGFRGEGSVKNNTLILDGRMTKIELPEITVAVHETIKSSSTFTSLSAADLGVKELKIQNTSGTLVVRGAATQFSGDIEIVSPFGDFVFGDTFSLSGKASKISIPSAGISIG